MTDSEYFIKICGITTEEDALLSVALGATAVGFVFAPSKRQVASRAVADIVKRLPPEVLRVGVFKDEAPERVSQICSHIGLNAVQLHGHESPTEVKWLAGRVPLVIKAFSALDPRLSTAGEYEVFAILVDAAQPGSGVTFDWSHLASVPKGERMILAGGLHPANVAAAIYNTGCFGVDVSSGVEKSPGRKDPIKLREFIDIACRAFDERGSNASGGELAGGANLMPERASRSPQSNPLRQNPPSPHSSRYPQTPVRRVTGSGRGPYDWQEDK